MRRLMIVFGILYTVYPAWGQKSLLFVYSDPAADHLATRCIIIVSPLF